MMFSRSDGFEGRKNTNVSRSLKLAVNSNRIEERKNSVLPGSRVETEEMGRKGGMVLCIRLDWYLKAAE